MRSNQLVHRSYRFPFTIAQTHRDASICMVMMYVLPRYLGSRGVRDESFEPRGDRAKHHPLHHIGKPRRCIISYDNLSFQAKNIAYVRSSSLVSMVHRNCRKTAVQVKEDLVRVLTEEIRIKQLELEANAERLEVRPSRLGGRGINRSGLILPGYTNSMRPALGDLFDSVVIFSDAMTNVTFLPMHSTNGYSR